MASALDRKHAIKNALTFSGYRILNRNFDRRNLEQVIKIAEICSNVMTGPRMMHFIVAIDQSHLDQVFDSRRFCQNIKEKLNSEIALINKSRSELLRFRPNPSFHIVFSIESKYKQSQTSPYLHIHILLFIDVYQKLYGPKEILIVMTKALSRISGIEKLTFDQSNTLFRQNGTLRPYGFLKIRDKRTKIKVSEIKDKHWHDLKTELKDAICRASYLCKLDQKDLLPEEFKRGNSFGHTRPPSNLDWKQ